LQHPTGVDLSAQVDAQADKTIFDDIIVPGVVVTVIRNRPVYPPFKASRKLTLGYALNDLEQSFVVHQARQGARGRAAGQTKLFIWADVLMHSFIKLAAVDAPLEELEEFRLEQLRESQIVSLIELAPEFIQVFV